MKKTPYDGTADLMENGKLTPMSGQGAEDKNAPTDAQLRFLALILFYILLFGFAGALVWWGVSEPGGYVWFKL